MANELIATATADSTVYSVILNASGQVWQTTTETFVTIVDANWANYDIAMVEQGTSTGIFIGTFPTAITTAGTYTIYAYERAGATPVVDDDTLVGQGYLSWDGSAASSTPLAEDLTTLQSVRSYMGITETTYNVLLLELIHQASAGIASYCDQVLASQSVTDTYQYNAPRRWIKLRNAIQPSLTTVTINAYEDEEATVEATNFYITDNGTVWWKPTSSGQGYFNGVTLITYTAGYDSIPYDLQMACNMLVKHLFDLRSKDFGVEKETIGDYSYTLASVTGGDLSAGVFAPVRAILDQVYTMETINIL